ncbi:MAG: lipoprotein signal peptidase [Bacteroidia bacterium]|nr:lipoprotein signal peptidase [Bacteroidia bacterium]
MKNLRLLAFLLLAVILVVDQIVKLYVKTHFVLGEEIHVLGNWFRIHFTENYGMAFGIEFGGKTGKIFLTLFRILFVAGILWYINNLIETKAGKAYVFSWTMIAAGALGNIIDSVFYGVYFGYDSWFHGRVVDMFYFPLIQTRIPEWFPFWAGEDFEFFRPVFNLADAAISIGFVLILLTQNQANPAQPATTAGELGSESEAEIKPE